MLSARLWRALAARRWCFFNRVVILEEVMTLLLAKSGGFLLKKLPDFLECPGCRRPIRVPSGE